MIIVKVRVAENGVQNEQKITETSTTYLTGFCNHVFFAMLLLSIANAVFNMLVESAAV